MKKRIPKKSTVEEKKLSWIYFVLCAVCWLIIIICGMQLISYYVFVSRTQGFFSQESIKFGMYLIIGAFFVMFINRNDVRKIFKIKDKDDTK